MYQGFSHIEELLSAVRADKNCSGVQSAMLNRYPVRFVLFDNFRDSRQFVSIMQNEMKCMVKNVGDWMDKDCDDRMLTHSKLEKNIEEFIAVQTDTDQVIAPFSELARFYDNNEKSEFDALIKTIKGIETKQQRLRIYIPIVGLEGKMSQFHNDSQIFIWYLKSTNKQIDYQLIMTDDTDFEVIGLQAHYSIVGTIHSWLDLWRNENAKSKIISTSTSLFANAQFAQPDNAFAFSVCHNVYQFLTEGLSLDFSDVDYSPSEEKHWLRLAKKIDIEDFTFEKFFNSYFHIDNLADYHVFLKTWFECKDEFEKWLLSKYYVHRFCNEGYICQALKVTKSYTNSDFFSAVALAIFKLENRHSHVEERALCLRSAAKHGVKLTEAIQKELCDWLRQIAETDGCSTAMQYLSPLTNCEKELALEWLSENLVTTEELKDFFPDLYYYLSPSIGTAEQWILDYIDHYKESKVHNCYSEGINSLIHSQNSSPIEFNNWYHNFKTTKTLLYNRTDIDVYYWIDGLGIDWIPYIQWLISQKKYEGIFLNEILVGCAHYPTTTSNNKQDLLDLSNNSLKKIGDLDGYAHKTNNHFPNTIIEELQIVKEAIYQIISEYNGRKIAIISDHGLTALSQYCSGFNMAGVESDHHGRVAIKKEGKCVSENEYVICDDGKTLCALQHKSLCSKVPDGQSAHGGCTPEEILVPVFIVSSQENARNWTATLMTKTISETDPHVRYMIKGNTDNLYPQITYGGKTYPLKRINNEIFESNKINLDSKYTTIDLMISDQIIQSDTIAVNLGATEDDLFDF